MASIHHRLGFFLFLFICGLNFENGDLLFGTYALAGPLADYSRECAQTIGVPVPSFRCDDPKATEIDPGRMESGGCRTPSHGSSACNLGTRFLRFDDVFVDDDGRRNVVNTLVMCRGSRRANGESTFHDIAVIQYNQTNNAACWFSRQGGDLPSQVPSPNAGTQAATDFWGPSQPNMDCRSCHDNGIYMRSPYAALVPPEERGMGYQRNNRTGDYEPGNGNGIPAFSSRMAKQGAMCSVGTEWNDRAVYPEIKIDPAAYTAYREREGLAAIRNLPGGMNVGYCTSCHYVGATFSCRMALDSTGHGNNNLRSPNTFPNGVWMPPRDELRRFDLNLNPQGADEIAAQQQLYDETFGDAIQALRTCCSNPDLTVEVNGEDRKVCGARFDLNERQRTLSENGPCALITPRANNRENPNNNTGNTNGGHGSTLGN